MNPADKPELARALFHEAGDALFLMDPSAGTIVDVNPVALRLTGLTRDEVVGTRSGELFGFESHGDGTRLNHAFEKTTVFHARDGYLLRTRDPNAWVPVNLSVARLHIPPRPLILLTARDCREQRVALLRLQKLESELRRVLGAVPDGVWSARRRAGRWEYRYLSTAFAQILGRSETELRTAGWDHFRDYLHPEDRARVRSGLRSLLRDGRSRWACEYRIVRPGGGIRWVADRLRLSRSPGGRAVRLDGILTDVTDRKLAEQELQRNEERFRRLLENAADGVAVLDGSGRVIQASASAGKHFGMQAGADPFAWAHPDDRLACRAAFEECLARPGSRTEFACKTNGEPGRRVECVLHDRRDDPAIGGIVLNARDVTDRRRAEEALAREHRLLRNLLDSVPDLIRYCNREGVYLGCNAAYEEYVGRPESEVVGKTKHDLYPPDRAADADAACQRVLETGKPVLVERGLSWPDGRAGIFETLLSPLTADDDRIIGVVAISRDVTARKRLEDQLTQAGRMEAIGRLAGGIAHEFNNLLTAVVGNLNLTRTTLPEGHPALDPLGAGEKAAWRAADLTGQLLSFARGGTLRLEPLDLNHTAEETIGLVRRTMDPRIVLVERLAKGLWPVSADHGLAGQLLLNLCLNARDAIPAGGTLTVETANVCLGPAEAARYAGGRPGDFVRLRVSDTGVGIAPDVLPRIFEPFFTTKPRGQGTGLGLAAVYGIAQQHSGWVHCESAVGRGTSFEAFFPRAQGTVRPVPDAGPPPSPLRGNGETILLADDEPLIRSLARTLLEQYGYRVLLAADGAEAVEVFARDFARIDLVVLDLTMPRLSGREVLREILRIDPAARVLLSSGYTAEQVSPEELRQARGFVAKPYRPRDLARAVRDALGKGPVAGEPSEAPPGNRP